MLHSARTFLLQLFHAKQTFVQSFVMKFKQLICKAVSFIDYIPIWSFRKIFQSQHHIFSNKVGTM